MKSAILTESKKPLKVANVDLPTKLEYGQVLVKIFYSGICKSQIMEIFGGRENKKWLPHLLGHEGSGKVVAIGKGVSKVSPGDWVILGWIKGKGKDVGGAKYQLEDQIINSGAITTFSTYTIASENRIVPLPPLVPKDLAVLFGCALPTGTGIVLHEIKPKFSSSIAVIGLGGIGLSALMACSVFECDPLIAIDVSLDKLELAHKLGATHTIHARNQDPLVEVQKITDWGIDSIYATIGEMTRKIAQRAEQIGLTVGDPIHRANHLRFLLMIPNIQLHVVFVILKLTMKSICLLGTQGFIFLLQQNGRIRNIPWLG